MSVMCISKIKINDTTYNLSDEDVRDQLDEIRNSIENSNQSTGVQSINGKSGDVILTANDIPNVATSMKIETVSNSKWTLTINPNTYYIIKNFTHSLNINISVNKPELAILDITTNNKGLDLGWDLNFSFNIRPNIEADKRYIILIANNTIINVQEITESSTLFEKGVSYTYWLNGDYNDNTEYFIDFVPVNEYDYFRLESDSILTINSGSYNFKIQGYSNKIYMNGGYLKGIEGEWQDFCQGYELFMTSGLIDDVYCGGMLATWSSIYMTGGTINLLSLFDGHGSDATECSTGDATLSGTYSSRPYIKSCGITGASSLTVGDYSTVDEVSIGGTLVETPGWSGDEETFEPYPNIAKLTIKDGGLVKKLTIHNDMVEITVEGTGKILQTITLGS